MIKPINWLRALREKYFPYTEKTVRCLALALTIMLVWLLIWALVLKLCIADDLIRNYYNLRSMTLKERIIWDIVPFQYRGSAEHKAYQMLSTVLNCFVLAPFGVTLSYVFKKTSVPRDAAICFGFSLFVEVLQAFTPFANPATEDVITNTAGYFIGLWIYRLVFRRLSNKQSVIFFASVNIACSLAVIYSLITAITNAPLIFKLLTRTY